MRSSPELDGKPAPLFTRPQEFGQIESAKRNRPPERIRQGGQDGKLLNRTYHPPLEYRNSSRLRVFRQFGFWQPLTRKAYRKGTGNLPRRKAGKHIRSAAAWLFADLAHYHNLTRPPGRIRHTSRSNQKRKPSSPAGPD